MLLRAVRFLDTMIQRDNLQKAAFLKDLGSIWPRVDARVLKFRMIPPLLAEARTEALQPVLLPLLLAMVEKQDDEASGSLTGRPLCGTRCVSYCVAQRSSTLAANALLLHRDKRVSSCCVACNRRILPR